jgi:hypothetical protein
MEKTIESDRTGINFTGFEEIITIAPTKAPKQIKTEPRFFDAARIYARPIGGIAASLALLALPALTLPGAAILVLIGEIYLIDWTYHRFTEARSGGTRPAETEPLEEDIRPEDEIDKFATRTGPKDQFTK